MLVRQTYRCDEGGFRLRSDILKIHLVPLLQMKLHRRIIRVSPLIVRITILVTPCHEQNRISTGAQGTLIKVNSSVPAILPIFGVCWE